jgi:methylmalonyl-CoA mutase N-terminal domain/subunit
VTLALRTQQVLAYETGVTNTVDPLGGSYFIESLTKQMQREAHAYFEQIESLGGMIAAIDAGFFRREIAEAAFAYQREVDARRKLIVGVNAFVEPAEKPIPILKVNESVEREHVAALRRTKENRSADSVRRALDVVRRAAESQTNLVEPLLSAAGARATVGELMNAMAGVFGHHTATVV